MYPSHRYPPITNPNQPPMMSGYPPNPAYNGSYMASSQVSNYRMELLFFVCYLCKLIGIRIFWSQFEAPLTITVFCFLLFTSAWKMEKRVWYWFVRIRASRNVRMDYCDATTNNGMGHCLILLLRHIACSLFIIILISW